MFTFYARRCKSKINKSLKKVRKKSMFKRRAIKEEHIKQHSFDYQMLSRLKMDCNYFLGNGNGYERHLWAGDVDSQIAEMKRIYKV